MSDSQSVSENDDKAGNQKLENEIETFEDLA